MLYLGIELSTFSVSIAALADGFSFLGESSFRCDSRDQLESWIRSFLIDDSEPITCFFSVKDFQSHQSEALKIIPSSFVSQTWYLVNERVLLNIYHTLSDIFSVLNKCPFPKSYVLAASNRFFEKRFIKKIYSSEPPLYSSSNVW